MLLLCDNYWCIERDGSMKCVLVNIVVILEIIGLLTAATTTIAIAQETTAPSSLPPPPPGSGDESHFRAQPTISEQGPVSPSLPLPKPTPKSGEYHFLGAKTSQGNDGIISQIQVTDPDVPRRSTNFYAAWIMEHRYGPDIWIQVGWAEVGWRDDKQYVFAYDTEHNEWHFYDQYPISPSMWIEVSITYEWGTTWAAWLWWGSVWILLDEADVGFSSPEYADQFGEVYISKGRHFHVPDTSFYDTHLLVEGSWSLWDRKYPTIEYNADRPYQTRWLNKYWNWYVHTFTKGKKN